MKDGSLSALKPVGVIFIEWNASDASNASSDFTEVRDVFYRAFHSTLSKTSWRKFTSWEAVYVTCCMISMGVVRESYRYTACIYFCIVVFICPVQIHVFIIAALWRFLLLCVPLAPECLVQRYFRCVRPHVYSYSHCWPLLNHVQAIAVDQSINRTVTCYDLKVIWMVAQNTE